MKDELDKDTGEIFDPEADLVGQDEDAIVVTDPSPSWLRSPYNYDRDAVSFETGLDCQDESLAQQHMAEDADINTIVKRFGLTGHMPQGAKLPTYGDFTGVTDFRSALEAVQYAEETFGELPADLRARFQNDPQLYLEFASDPANQQEIYDLGLAERPRSSNPPPTDAPQAPPAAPAAPQSGAATTP